MYKLLIDSPGGEQKIIVIKEGGGYFDKSAVVWDESKDGVMPKITLGSMIRSGKSLVVDAARKAQHDAIINARKAEKTKMETLRSSVDSDSDISAFKGKSGTDIDTWFAANVTTGLQAARVLKKIIKLLVLRGIL